MSSRSLFGGSLILLQLSILAFSCPASAEVRFAQGLVYRHLEAPREVGGDDPLTLDLHFTADGPLDRDYHLFIHTSRPRGRGSAPCRIVSDTALGDVPSTRWSPGPLHATVSIQSPNRCGPGPLHISIGFFVEENDERLSVLDGVGHHESVHVATVLIRDHDEDVEDAVVVHQPPLEQPPRAPLVIPSAVQAVLVILTALVMLLVARRFLPFDLIALRREEGTESHRWRWLLPAAPLMLFAAGVFVCLGFVKDDAYISFRYAQNLVSGRGMVFNVGERVEGYTNFLWTILLAPFEWAGWDLIQVCDVLGPLLGAALLVLVVRASRQLSGPGPLGSDLWPAMWLASSSSFTLWCVGGLEQSLAMLLPFTGTLLTWRGWKHKAARLTVAGGFALAAGCLTRPEGHLFVVMIGLLLIWEVARDRANEERKRLFLAWAAPLAAVLGPYHIWRVFYFGSVLPNTYLVKAVSGIEVYRSGLFLLENMLRFNLTGVVIGLALFSLLLSGHRAARAFSVVLSLLFLVYIVKVGSDELMWHRLFLPALPFVAIAAGEGLRLLIDGLYNFTGRQYRVFTGLVGWVIVLGGCYYNLSFTYGEMRGNTGYTGCSGMNHPDLGKFLTRHSRPGELVAFQDMGATPYHAPDLRFLDFVGLVDRDIALLLQHNGVHPFVGATRARHGGEYCDAHRDYVFERNPEWIVLVPHPRGRQIETAWRRFRSEDPEEALRSTDAFRFCQFDCRLYFDPRFRERYVHVRTWPRSSVYYLSAFMRRDLWERAPTEVLLDEVPDDLPGPRAAFANRVELLGGEIESEEVVERHEVFVTTWWRVPGQRSSNLLFFIHLVGRDPPHIRTSLDHPAGDWLYPANRWEPGQTIEDRVLVQIPVGLPPGTYDVHVGMFNRRTGARVPITEGVDAGDHRIFLGALEVRPMRHPLDPLIPRTDPDEQRRRMPRAQP